ncbi:MAG: hypothetical protein ABIJ23_05295 [Candidatus Magasanikbacteria bacterium]
MKKLIALLGGIFFLLILVGAGCSSTSVPTEETLGEENIQDITASVTIEGGEEIEAEVEVTE